MSLDDDLYETDFFRWTQAQAKALRARGRGDNSIDYDRLAEEVADLGKSEFFSVRSFVTRIIEHLYKLAWSRNDDPKASWRAEITRFRAELDERMTKSIRAKAKRALEKAHEAAGKAVKIDFARLEPGAKIDLTLRWSLEEILGEKDDPIG